MIRTEGTQFKDEHGRTLILRGVNLGGSSKVPFQPYAATHVREEFFDHRNVSFVGRPFPLEEADEHFSRLRSWGFTFLRFLITWEAIEHAGPGIYDEAYLDYVFEIAQKAGEHGIDLFVDPHQDVWSRFSGGDGAPGWTFEMVGMDITRFSEAGAAIIHAVHGDPFPRMIWPTNGTKLAAATMFTLFFGGNDFAPQTKVDGEPVQEFLQRHYIGAIKQVAARLKDLPNVVGYDTMNEPLPGFIGWSDLNAHGGILLAGESPTPFEAMLLGAGIPQKVAVWRLGVAGFRGRRRRLVNPDGVSVWREGVVPVWLENGVWDLDTDGVPHLLRPDHFARLGDRSVDFAEDYLRPFAMCYAREIRSVAPTAHIFLEGVPGEMPPRWNLDGFPNVVHAPHWYDGITLYTKRFIPFLGVDLFARRLVIGRKRVLQSFVDQLMACKMQTREQIGPVPTLIGEFGIPFDMHDKRAYRTGDFSRHVKAMDRTFRAIEANLLNSTLWNYTTDNDNLRGDQWNDEDLSIFSRDQQIDPHDINSGGRALEAAVRPYARKVAGEPVQMVFDLATGVFTFSFRHDPEIHAPTEIYVPNLQYPRGYEVEVSDGSYEADHATQVLVYRHGLEQKAHIIRIHRKGSRPTRRQLRQEAAV